MCGIFGYVGQQKASPILLKGLRKLEYRGYDSVGMLTLHNETFYSKKGVGKVDSVNNELDFASLLGSIGISHSRWATHGGVTKENAHPQFSQDGSIAVVHNGIIENFQRLRSELVSEGFTFLSETDTEIIPNLMQKYLHQGMTFDSAFVEALKKIQGNYALLAVHKDKKTIAFAKNGSPLCIGIGQGEYFLASDVPAFLEYTKDVIFLEDGQYGFIKLNQKENNDLELCFFNADAKEIEIESEKIEWTLEQAEKGNEPHFMIKEIKDQKLTIQQSIEQDPTEFAKAVEMLSKAKGIFFVGCGTSFHACLSASYQFSHISKKHVNVVLASEFRSHTSFLTSETVLVAVSQSGETADLLDAIKVAKQKSVKIVSIVNVKGSSLDRISDMTIPMQAGPEICVVSTKAYTAQLSILTLLAYTLSDPIHGLQIGKEKIQKAVDATPKLIDDNLEVLKTLAKKIKDQKSIFLIGRDIAYPAALEGALKIKEVSYIHAEGFAGGELKHGTIALIETGTPCVTLATPKTRDLIISNAMEIKSRGGYIIGVDSENNEVYDHTIIVPNVEEANAIILTIPLQILAYYLAVERGCDVDKPRNLAKSVTVK